MKVKRSKSPSPEPSGSNERNKRPRIEPAAQNADTETGNILDFSDDVLLNILKYLHPQDLLALSLCCKRLDRVCRDRTLWKVIDCRYTAITMDDLKEYVKFLQPTTTCIALRSSLVPNSILKRDFLASVVKICQNIQEFVLEECNIDAEETNIFDFPPTIEKLSLKGCALHNLHSNKSYFFQMTRHMQHLTSLTLSNCAWLTSHSLLTISKIPNLKELRLNSCQQLNECVAYASLATRFGFKVLEILDVRDTALGDSEICCFSSTTTLTHLYLECPMKLRNQGTAAATRGRSRPLPSLEHLEGEPVHEDRNLVQYLIEEDIAWDDVEHCLISDRAVCALGASGKRYMRLIFQRDLVVEEDNWSTNDLNLKTLVIRNYSRVTDQSLIHLAVSASMLEYLDVTGTSVTKDGVATFKTARPEVKVISSFNEE